MALIKSPQRLSAYHVEMKSAENLYAHGDLDAAFRALERAHILGQPWMGPHMRAHGMMLKIGLRRRDAREILGQIIRILGGGVLSWFGGLPDGNTGGANVPARQSMPIPADLKALCDPEGV